MDISMDISMDIVQPRWIFQWIKLDKTFILPGQNWVTRLGQGQMGVRLSALPVAIRLGGPKLHLYIYIYTYKT